MARWEVMLFRKKGVRLGVIDAREERKATAKAAETFNGPPALPVACLFRNYTPLRSLVCRRTELALSQQSM